MSAFQIHNNINILTNYCFQLFEVLLKWRDHLLTVDTFQTHGKHTVIFASGNIIFSMHPLISPVAVQTLTNMLKAVRKTNNQLRGIESCS